MELSPVWRTSHGWHDHHARDDLLGAGCPNSPLYQAVVEMLKNNFLFRGWKEEQPVLKYCGCESGKTEDGGRKLHQTKDLEKVKPINNDKQRSSKSARSLSCATAF